MATIEKLLKLRLKQPWPEEEEELGPATCGGVCRTAHAMARAEWVNLSGLSDDEAGAYVWIFFRPCNVHEAQQARKWGVVSQDD